MKQCSARMQAFAALLLAGTALLPAGASAQQANVTGSWSQVADWPMIPIHAALLPDGKVVTYGATPQGGQGGFTYDVWDPARGTDGAAHLTLPNGTSTDSFCASSVLQPWNGQIMIVGGASANGSGNEFKSSAFSWKTQRLTEIQQVAMPRWYSTLTTLPDGRVAVNGGVVPYADWTQASNTMELYTPGQGWRALPGTTIARENTGSTERRYWFPRVWPVAGNKLFVLTGKTMYQLGYDGQGSMSNQQAFDRPNWGGTSSAVMYAPKKILQFGGGAGGNNEGDAPGASNSTVVDISSYPYRLIDVGGLHYNRHWPTATVLPNGEVLATGGSSRNNEMDGPAYAAEIWNPATGQWRVGASMQVARMYHSVALLLPDGRVLSGGGGAPGPVYGKNAEIYSPPYLFGADGRPASRPVIATEPGIVRLGATMAIKTSGDNPITRFTLVKTGAVTHGNNMDQRYQELSFTGSNGAYSVRMPTDPVDATPGYYMLFALDSKGVPSVAKMLRVPSPTADDGTVPPTSGTQVASTGTTGGGTAIPGGTGTTGGSGTTTPAPVASGNVTAATPAKAWVSIGGWSSKVASSADGTTVVVNKDSGAVWRYRADNAWYALPGQAMREIAVGGASRIYGIGLDGIVYRWDGAAWKRVGHSASTISAAADGTVVVTTATNDIWVKLADDFNEAWKQLPGKARKVAAIDATRFWSIGTDDNVYRYAGSGAWTKVGVDVSDIAASSDGSISVVNKWLQAIWRKTSDDTTANWQWTDGKATQLAAPNATWLLAIGMDGGVYRFAPAGTQTSAAVR